MDHQLLLVISSLGQLGDITRNDNQTLIRFQHCKNLKNLQYKLGEIFNFIYLLICRFRWTKVGEVTDLICYPIKSGGFVRLDEFECNQLGIGMGRMRDRTFMFVNENFNFVTARKYPKLIHIMPEFDQNVMTLTAPEMGSVRVDMEALLKTDLIEAEVWDEKVKAHDAGNEIAEWISKFILKENSGLRLVFFASDLPTRDVREKNKVFETAVRKDTGACHDATSYMLINEASVEELNSRVEKAVTPLQFRPNIVVKGPKAYEEDSWKFIKFGERTIFKNVKPCTRYNIKLKILN